MAEYIIKDDVLAKFTEGDGDDKFTEGYNFAVNEYSDIIKNISAADVQPVKHGQWIETHISLCKWIPEDEKEEGHSFYMAEMKCSCCKRYNTATFTLTLNKPDFCQHCGARMDLKGGDAE